MWVCSLFFDAICVFFIAVVESSWGAKTTCKFCERGRLQSQLLKIKLKFKNTLNRPGQPSTITQSTYLALKSNSKVKHKHHTTIASPRHPAQEVCPISSEEGIQVTNQQRARATNALGLKFYMKKWISQICLKT